MPRVFPFIFFFLSRLVSDRNLWWFKSKKYKYQQLQELLLSFEKEDMSPIGDKLHLSFNDRKENLEQIDDATVIGIRL